MATTYADFITDLRADVGDFAIRRFETADGDAATSVFNLQNPKVLEGSYTIQVGGVTQPAVTNYALYPDVGQVIFTNGHIPASGNDNVSFQYQSVNLLDADWINIINQVLSQLRKKLWVEVLDQTTLLSVIDQYDYVLSGIAADVVHVLDVEYKLASGSTNQWNSLRAITNVVFYRDLQKLHMRPAFNTSGYPMRVRLNRAYAQGTTTGATFEPQARYWPVLKKFCHAIYLERKAMLMMNETSAVSKEKTFENATEMRKLAGDVRAEALAMLKEIRPSKPAKQVPIVIAGISI